MARIRTIKPEAFTSDSLSTLPRGTRWTFAGLWTYADDEGRCRDDARLVKAALYPLDDATTLEDVTSDLAQIEQMGGICRYRVGRRAYFHLPKWREHQKINRPTASKLPDCPKTDHFESQIADSLSPHGVLTEPSMENVVGTGNREQGTGNTCASADAEREFAEWYSSYPRKRGKGQALKAYRAARKKADPQVLLDALRRQSDALMAKGPEFCPYPATWLNGERWNDEPDNAHHLPQTDEHGRVKLPPLPGKSPWGRA